MFGLWVRAMVLVGAVSGVISTFAWLSWSVHGTLIFGFVLVWWSRVASVPMCRYPESFTAMTSVYAGHRYRIATCLTVGRGTRGVEVTSGEPRRRASRPCRTAFPRTSIRGGCRLPGLGSRVSWGSRDQLQSQDVQLRRCAAPGLVSVRVRSWVRFVDVGGVITYLQIT